MQLETVRDFFSLLSAVEQFKGGGFIFRGVAKSHYELAPKVGRAHVSQRYSIGAEQELLRIFKEWALPHVRTTPTNDLEWLWSASRAADTPAGLDEQSARGRVLRNARHLSPGRRRALRL